MTESRFLTGYGETATDDPGIVLDESGQAVLVAADGSRSPLGPLTWTNVVDSVGFVNGFRDATEQDMGFEPGPVGWMVAPGGLVFLRGAAFADDPNPDGQTSIMTAFTLPVAPRFITFLSLVSGYALLNGDVQVVSIPDQPSGPVFDGIVFSL